MTQGFPFEKFLKPQQKSTHSTLTKNNPYIGQISNKNEDLLKSIFEQSQPASKKMTHGEISQDNEFAPIFDALCPLLLAEMGKVKFDTFVQGKVLLQKIDDGCAQFIVQTQFIQSTLENSFKPFFQASLKELMGSDYQVEFRLAKSDVKSDEVDTTSYSSKSRSSLQDLLSTTESTPVAPRKTKSSFTLDLTPSLEDLEKQAEGRFINHMEDNLKENLIIDPAKTFENFIVGPSNNLAFATASAVSESPGKSGKYPCLYLYSDSGLGKTHLLHAVANGIINKHPHLNICIISARDFMKELIDAFKDKKLDKFQAKYTEKVDVLMIDDIHELKNKPSTQEEFFHIFNFLHNKGKQLIFTSDKSPDKINGIEERIITRLQWGLVVDIQKPDFETRTAILKKKAIELDLFVQDDVLSLIASSIKTSIRELEGSLIRLQAHAELMEAEVDTEMAKSILKLQEINEKPAATLESVCRASSQYFKIAVADLRSKSRNKNIVKARHIAWYLSKNIVGSTFMEIGKYYSNRDHSSVMHGVSKITEQLKNDSQLSKDLIFLENNI